MGFKPGTESQRGLHTSPVAASTKNGLLDSPRFDLAHRAYG